MRFVSSLSKSKGTRPWKKYEICRRKSYISTLLCFLAKLLHSPRETLYSLAKVLFPWESLRLIPKMLCSSEKICLKMIKKENDFCRAQCENMVCLTTLPCSLSAFSLFCLQFLIHSFLTDFSAFMTSLYKCDLNMATKSQTARSNSSDLIWYCMQVQ